MEIIRIFLIVITLILLLTGIFSQDYSKTNIASNVLFMIYLIYLLFN